MRINLADFESGYDKVVSNPSAEENGRSFTLINRSKFKIRKWAIDKDIFKNRVEKRCDYLLLVERLQGNIYYWIELKGENVNEGYRQILSTITNVNVEHTAIQQARIIATKNRTPNVRSKEYFKLAEIIEQSGGEILVRINHYSEII